MDSEEEGQGLGQETRGSTAESENHSDGSHNDATVQTQSAQQYLEIALRSLETVSEELQMLIKSGSGT